MKKLELLKEIFILTVAVSGMCEVSGTMLPILLYHNVTDFYDPLNKGDNISPRVLESHFKMLKDFGFNTKIRLTAVKGIDNFGEILI